MIKNELIAAITLFIDISVTLARKRGGRKRRDQGKANTDKKIKAKVRKQKKEKINVRDE